MASTQKGSIAQLAGAVKLPSLQRQLLLEIRNHNRPADPQRTFELVREIANYNAQSMAFSNIMAADWSRIIEAVRKTNATGRGARMRFLLKQISRLDFNLNPRDIVEVVSAFHGELRDANDGELLYNELRYFVAPFHFPDLQTAIVVTLVRYGIKGQGALLFSRFRDKGAGPWFQHAYNDSVRAIYQSFNSARARTLIRAYRMGTLGENGKREAVDKGDSVAEALYAVLEWMKRDGCHPLMMFFNQLASLLGWRVTDFEKAMAYLRWVESEGGKPDAVTFNVLMGHLGDHGDIAGVEELHAEMKRRGIKEDAETIRRLLESILEHKQGMRAYELYMAHRHIKNDILCVGDQALGRRLAMVLLDDVTAPTEPVEAVIADMFELGIPAAVQVELLLQRMVLQNRSKEAMTLLETYRKQFKPHLFPHMTREEAVMVTVRGYNFVIDSLCRKGLRKDAMTVFHLIKEHGLEPTSETFKSLIHAAGEAGDVNGARDLWQQMLDAGIQPDVMTFTTMLQSYIGNEQLEEAAQLLHRMNESGVKPNSYTYNVFIKGLIEAGQYDEAHALLCDMERQGVPPDHVTRSILMWGYAKERRWKEAMAMREEIIRNTPPGEQVDPSIHGVVVKALIEERRDVEKAEEYLKNAIDDGEPNSKSTSRKLVGEYAAWNLVLGAYLEKGDVANALRIKAEMAAAGRLDKHTLITLVKHYTEIGDMNAAEEEVRQALEGRHRVLVDFRFVFPILLRGARRVGDFGRVRHYWNQLEAAGAELTQVSYSLCIGGLTAGREFETAEKLAEDAKSRFGVYLGANLRNTIMDVYGKQGKWREMEAEYERGLQAAQTNWAKAATWAILMNGYGMGGNWEKAWNIWCRIWKPVSPTVSHKKKNLQRKAATGTGTGTVVADSDSFVSSNYDLKQVIADATEDAPDQSTLKKETQQRFGVDQAHVSVILDAFGFAGRVTELRSLWHELRSVGFPLNENNYTSYMEALVRCGFPEEGWKVISETIQGDGVDPIAKPFVNFIGLTMQQERPDLVRKAAAFVGRNYPEFVEELARKIPSVAGIARAAVVRGEESRVEAAGQDAHEREGSEPVRQDHAPVSVASCDCRPNKKRAKQGKKEAIMYDSPDVIGDTEKVGDEKTLQDEGDATMPARVARPNKKKAKKPKKEAAEDVKAKESAKTGRDRSRPEEYHGARGIIPWYRPDGPGGQELSSASSDPHPHFASAIASSPIYLSFLPDDPAASYLTSTFFLPIFGGNEASRMMDALADYKKTNKVPERYSTGPPDYRKPMFSALVSWDALIKALAWCVSERFSHEEIEFDSMVTASSASAESDSMGTASSAFPLCRVFTVYVSSEEALSSPGYLDKAVIPLILALLALLGSTLDVCSRLAGGYPTSLLDWLPLMLSPKLMADLVVLGKIKVAKSLLCGIAMLAPFAFVGFIVAAAVEFTQVPGIQVRTTVEWLNLRL
ncbi:hypothetical protein HK104_010284 [Borealophlyctis nickersoniae]|nr:hypothetical protein HK104_010284 [Borealophlyctis nickersoniae]